MALLLISVLAILSSSCGDDPNESDADAENEIRTQLNAWVSAQHSADAETFLAHVTENWLATVNNSTEEEVRANPSETLGGGTFTIGEIEVSGKTAAVQIDVGPQGSLRYTQAIEAIKEGNTWKADRLYAASADNVPAEAKKVDIELDEWRFAFEEEQLQGGTPLVLRVRNNGDEPHMLVLVSLSNDANLRQLLELEPPSPRHQGSRQELGAAFFFGPDDPVAEVVLTETLTPGRYVFVCFVTSPGESVQHAAKEMFAEFTVE